MKVLLIFRDPGRGGTSVEAAFHDLARSGVTGIEIESLEYSDHRGVWYNYRRIRATKADVFHITSDIYWLALLLPRGKCVLTIHDIGHYSGMRGIRKWVYGRIFLSWPARRAAAISTVSRFTREALQGILSPSVMKKVVVIYNPVPRSISEHALSSVPGNKVVLQVGTSSHKNCESVIRAMQGLPYSLRIIGRLSKAQEDLLQQVGIRFAHQQDLPYAGILEAYRGADVVTFISLYEGFGMPVMEAQAMGRPVITSRKASLPEVAGAGAHFVNDPFDSAEIRQAIVKVIEDRSYQDELIREGLKNIKRFDHAISNRSFMDLYAKALTH